MKFTFVVLNFEAMKNLYILLSLCFTAFLINISQLKAQDFDYIDSLKIIPGNPTTEDIVKVVCYSSFEFSGCKLFLSEVHLIRDSTVSVKAYQAIGEDTIPCNSIDTIIIGKLNARNYILKYILSTSGNGDMEMNFLKFTVSQATDIKRNPKITDMISVYPNPASTNLFISSQSNSVYKVALYDMLGKTMYENNFSQNLSIDVSAMPKGVYFVKSINIANNTQTIHKIIIH